jgi:hypothetical protein
MNKKILNIDSILIDKFSSLKESSKPRNSERIEELLFLIYHFWRKNPDLRLGQIIENIAIELNSNSFYIEDSEIINWIKKNLK